MKTLRENDEIITMMIETATKCASWYSDVVAVCRGKCRLAQVKKMSGRPSNESERWDSMRESGYTTAQQTAEGSIALF